MTSQYGARADLPELQRRRRRGALYLRLSDGDDLERQRRDCTRMLEREGWDLVDTYEDPDESASRYNQRKRTDFYRLLGDLKTGRVDGVVTYDSDRLVRQPKELEALIDLVEHRDVVMIHEKGIIDLKSDDGKAGARMACVFAARESDAMSRRWRNLHRHRAENGMTAGGGRRAFGYESGGMELCEPEAAVIRAAVEKLFAGASGRSIVVGLTAAGIRTPTGALWSWGTFRRVLIGPRIAGIREHRRVNPDDNHRRVLLGTYKAAWPAIISEEDHLRLKAKLVNPERSALVDFSRKHPLTGILYCGREGCGRRMTGNNALGKYVCQSAHGCRRCSTKLELIEELVVASLIDHVDSRRLSETRTKRRATKASETPGLDPVAEIQRLGERLKLLSADYYVHEKIDEVSYQGAREKLEAALRLAEGIAAELVPEEAASQLPEGPLREAWDGMSAERKRAILRAEIVKITLAPGWRGAGNLPIKDRVDIEWRQPARTRRRR